MQSSMWSQNSSCLKNKVDQKLRIWVAVINEQRKSVELRESENGVKLPSDAELKVLANELCNMYAELTKIENYLKTIENLGPNEKQKAYEAINNFFITEFYSPFSKDFHAFLYGIWGSIPASIIFAIIFICTASPLSGLALPIGVVLGAGFGVYQANEKVKKLSDDTQRLLFN